MSYGKLHELLAKGLVTGIGLEAAVFKEEAAGCHDCVMGKHERMPFPYSSRMMSAAHSMSW